jgi:hypothetical protein
VDQQGRLFGLRLFLRTPLARIIHEEFCCNRQLRAISSCARSLRRDVQRYAAPFRWIAEWTASGCPMGEGQGWPDAEKSEGLFLSSF